MRSIILFTCLILGVYGNAQENNGKDLQIFLDCQFCDQTYYRQNLGHAEFVRDRKVADIHLLFLRQRTGSGGWSESIQFIGLEDYAEMEDTVNFSIDVNMTSDERRKLELKFIELGLIRFWLKKGDTQMLDVSINQEVELNDTVEKDPWDYWVFNVGVGGWANGQETYQTINGNANFSARRVTEKNKFSIRGGYNRRFQKYIIGEDETRTNQQSSWVNAQEVISLSDHWSYGVFAEAGNSIFSNYQFYLEPRTGIEYDVFDYEESATKQVIAAYEVGYRYNDYYDTTIFNKASELRPFHRVTLAGSVNQPWGSFTGSASYQNFLHNLSLQSADFWVRFNVRLFKGFSWRINGGFSILHDQINLKKEDASYEDILLQQQQLGTGYSYWMNTGINYSFGSIYNSIVNPRFDF